MPEDTLPVAANAGQAPRASRPAVPQVPAAHLDAGHRRAAHVGGDQHLFLVPGNQDRAVEPAAREGGRGGVPDRAIHPPDRAAARLRRAAAARCRRRRVAPHRVPEAAAPGAGSDGHRAARRQRPRADRRFAPGHGHHQLGQGPLAGAGIPQRAARQAMVRTGVLPQGNRTVHDDRHPIGKRNGPRDGCRGQPQIHLGRGFAHQDRRQGQGVCRRPQRLPDRRPGYRPGAAQDRPVQPAAREGRASAARAPTPRRCCRRISPAPTC